MQLVFWLGTKQIRYQDLNHRKISAAASTVVPLRGSDYFIFPPAVSPETIADLSAGKIGKQEGKANSKLIRISLPCHPSIPLRCEPSPPWGKQSSSQFPQLFPFAQSVFTDSLSSAYSLDYLSPSLAACAQRGTGTFTYDSRRHE